MYMFLLFSKESCGPCRLVDKYLVAINDDRVNAIEKIDLEDVGSEPTQENKDLAKLYGVTATPVLIIVTPQGLKVEEFIGGVEITKNIQQTFDKYYDKSP